MCDVVRYICIEDVQVEVKESFLNFFAISGKLLLSPQKRYWNNWMMMDRHNHLSWTMLWQSWNYDRNSGDRFKSKKLLPVRIYALWKALWTFTEFTSLGSVALRVALSGKKCIHSFNSLLNDGKHCRMYVEQ